MISGSQKRSRARIRQRGFSMLELVTVMAIALVISAMTIPALQSSVQYFRFRGAVSSVTGAIQSTRYQAIFQGCPYQIAFSATNFNYQLSNAPLSSTTNTCATTFSTVGSAIPLTGKNVALSSDITLQFNPGGKVSNPLSAGSQTVTLTSGNRTATIVVSNYGNINVTITP